MDPRNSTGMGGIVQPVRQSHVSGQYERAIREAKTLHEYISEMEMRLSSVTRDCPQPTSAKPEKSELVPHAEALSSLADILEQANGRLKDLLERIEL